jgi:hypothetical protein
VPVGVAEPCRHDRDARLECIEDRVRGRRATAVVRDLEHVQAPSFAGEPAVEQARIHVILDVAREQHPTAPESEIEHDRGVVDAPAVVG